MSQSADELLSELGLLLKGARLLSEEVLTDAPVGSRQEDLLDSIEDACVVADKLRNLLDRTAT